MFLYCTIIFHFILSINIDGFFIKNYKEKKNGNTPISLHFVPKSSYLASSFPTENWSSPTLRSGESLNKKIIFTKNNRKELIDIFIKKYNQQNKINNDKNKKFSEILTKMGEDPTKPNLISSERSTEKKLNPKIVNPSIFEDDFDDDFDDEVEEEIQQQINDLSFYNKKQIEHFKKTYEYHKSNNQNNEKYTNYNSNEYDETDNDDTFPDKTQKSENFEVIKKNSINFSYIGGYESVKNELYQVVDLLKNPTKYNKFNIRVPKGLILEGPPGNGKTLFAKALAGEANTGFISVSGSEFQDKYVGVGSSRIRELFALAKKNKPCIIFIDEIDALGRKRSNDGETSGSERDSTLNQLLVGLDGFQPLSGVFVVGATNRIDLLDTALIRPGRIDKKIHIGVPNEKTREVITNLYIKGKPYDESVRINEFIRNTEGFSGAQIENVLNEAMLNALRNNREQFNMQDLEYIINKQMVGWQPIEHNYTNSIINRISVHEMGHAIVGMCSPNHSKVSKVIINLFSPNSPAYTVFENNLSNVFTKETLFEHLMVLLGGRIAEEVIYQTSVTTGAINDFQESQKLAEQMILHYGMGENATIYSTLSEHHRNLVDSEITNIIKKAYKLAEEILYKHKYTILFGSQLLQEKKILYWEDLQSLFLLSNTSSQL
jgi:cell division protease FtsH